jgi:hypothetical protein
LKLYQLNKRKAESLVFDLLKEWVNESIYLH